MFRYTLPLVATYQAVAGGVALIVLGDAALGSHGSIALLHVAGMALISVISGVLLARSQERWLWLASATQFAQILYVITPWIQYMVIVGVQAGPAVIIHEGPITAWGISLRGYPMAACHLTLGKATDTILVGLNLVALGMWLAVHRAARIRTIHRT